MKKKLIIAMLGMTMLASLNGCLSKEEIAAIAGK